MEKSQATLSSSALRWYTRNALNAQVFDVDQDTTYFVTMDGRMDDLLYAASPQTFRQADTITKVQTAYGRSVISELIIRHRQLAPGRNPDSLAILQHLLDGHSAFTPAVSWHPSLGECLHAVITNQADKVDAAAVEYALHAYYHGCRPHGDTFTFQLSIPRIMNFGPFHLTSKSDAGIRQVGDHFVIHAEDTHPLTEEPHLISPGREIVLIPAVDCSSKRYDQSMKGNAEFSAHFVETYATLTVLLPSYTEWLDRVVRQVAVLIPIPTGSLRSGNVYGFPGYVYLSGVPNTMFIAETLVHEGSHMYYYLINRVLPLVDRSVTATYFNPFVSDNRTIDRILLAYHAFANVDAFYANADSQGLGVADTFVASPQYKRNLQTLENTLMASNALTHAGRRFVETIAGELTPWR